MEPIGNLLRAVEDRTTRITAIVTADVVGNLNLWRSKFVLDSLGGGATSCNDALDFCEVLQYR